MLEITVEGHAHSANFYEFNYFLKKLVKFANFYEFWRLQILDLCVLSRGELFVSLLCIFLWLSSLTASTSAIDCQERPVAKMTCYVLNGSLISILSRSLTNSL